MAQCKVVVQERRRQAQGSSALAAGGRVLSRPRLDKVLGLIGDFECVKFAGQMSIFHQQCRAALAFK
jgi:hypothetical protein